ncbi:MAG: hypothetical protein AAF202_10815 [Pseudomonadota bacterium]
MSSVKKFGLIIGLGMMALWPFQNCSEFESRSITAQSANPQSQGDEIFYQISDSQKALTLKVPQAYMEDAEDAEISWLFVDEELGDVYDIEEFTESLFLDGSGFDFSILSRGHFRVTIKRPGRRLKNLIIRIIINADLPNDDGEDVVIGLPPLPEPPIIGLPPLPEPPVIGLPPLPPGEEPVVGLPPLPEPPVIGLPPPPPEEEPVIGLPPRPPKEEPVVGLPPLPDVLGLPAPKEPEVLGLPAPNSRMPSGNN